MPSVLALGAGACRPPLALIQIAKAAITGPLAKQAWQKQTHIQMRDWPVPCHPTIKAIPGDSLHLRT